MQGTDAVELKDKKRPQVSAAATRKERGQVLRLLTPTSATETLVLGVAGAVGFFILWEVAHYMTPEESKRFLPSPQHVISTMYTLVAEKGFLNDVAKSAFRIFASFFVACLVAIPLGVLMGCFSRVRAFVNPVISRCALSARGVLHPAAARLVRPHRHAKDGAAVPWRDLLPGGAHPRQHRGGSEGTDRSRSDHGRQPPGDHNRGRRGAPRHRRSWTQCAT